MAFGRKDKASVPLLDMGVSTVGIGFGRLW